MEKNFFCEVYLLSGDSRWFESTELRVQCLAQDQKHFLPVKNNESKQSNDGLLNIRCDKYFLSVGQSVLWNFYILLCGLSTGFKAIIFLTSGK